VRPSVSAADYIQLYAGNAETLRQSLERIQSTARHILRSLPLLEAETEATVPTSRATDLSSAEHVHS
jgi:hypothetical protein